jgi:hypothetical protein
LPFKEALTASRSNYVGRRKVQTNLFRHTVFRWREI